MNPVCRSRTDRTAHSPDPDLQESSVAEGVEEIAPLQEKLHGPADALQKTTELISRAGPVGTSPG